MRFLTIFSGIPSTAPPADRVEVQFKATGTTLPINGVSNRYDDTYVEELVGVIDATDFADVVSRLNRTLQDLWPCGPAYYCGMCCAMCTCGVSLLLPNVCVSEAEKHANMLLANISARAKFYDRGIAFHLRKGSSYLVPRSWLVVSYPKTLHRNKVHDMESGYHYDKRIPPHPVNEEPSPQHTRLKST